MREYHTAIVFYGGMALFSINVFPRCELWMDVPMVMLLGAIGCGVAFVWLLISPGARKQLDQPPRILGCVTACFSAASSIYMTYMLWGSECVVRSVAN